MNVSDPMNVVQILPTVSYGDAVSNDAVAIAKVIEDMGYKTGIYAENVDTRLSDPLVHKIERLPRLRDSDIVIFNHSTGTDLCYKQLVKSLVQALRLHIFFARHWRLR